jgi:hypothetical protein
MNWNLVWNLCTDLESNANSCDSKFIFYLGDEPILTKSMYGQIYRTEKESWLTFVENSHKFSFEDFNEFIMDFEKSSQAKITFDNKQTCLGREEAFAYDSDSNRFIVALDSYTSNMIFSIPMDERTRTQFVKEFRKCLNHYLQFFESSTKLNSYTLDSTHI